MMEQDDSQSPVTSRYRFRTGLPFPGIFGHTTLEIERRDDSGAIDIRRYGLTGWQKTLHECIIIIFLALFGFTVPGHWESDALNFMGIGGPWHPISRDDADELVRTFDWLCVLKVRYNLYTRNSYQMPRRITAACLGKSQ